MADKYVNLKDDAGNILYPESNIEKRGGTIDGDLNVTGTANLTDVNIDNNHSLTISGEDAHGSTYNAEYKCDGIDASHQPIFEIKGSSGGVSLRGISGGYISIGGAASDIYLKPGQTGHATYNGNEIATVNQIPDTSNYITKTDNEMVKGAKVFTDLRVINPSQYGTWDNNETYYKKDEITRYKVTVRGTIGNTYVFPDYSENKSVILATTEDLSNKLDKTGGTINGDLTVSNSVVNGLIETSSYGITLRGETSSLNLRGDVDISTIDSIKLSSSNHPIIFNSGFIYGLGGYYKLPDGRSNDGSTSDNRHTIATQEWIHTKAGATVVTTDSDINSTQYLKVGKYSITNASRISNLPSNMSEGDWGNSLMTVSMLGRDTKADPATSAYLQIIRELTDFRGVKWTQYVIGDGVIGHYTYGPWTCQTLVGTSGGDIKQTLKTINYQSILGEGNIDIAGGGGLTNLVNGPGTKITGLNYDSDGNTQLKSLTFLGNTFVPATAMGYGNLTVSRHNENLTNDTEGVLNISVGNKNKVKGLGSAAFGGSNTVGDAINWSDLKNGNVNTTDRFNFATGEVNSIKGNCSFASGQENIVYGWCSQAFGYNNDIRGQASVGFGSNNTTSFNTQAVFGTFNDNKNNTLFEVGNGSSDSDRKNAFEIYRDGHAELGSMGSTKKSIATKDYVDTNKGAKLYKHTIIFDASITMHFDFTIVVFSVKSTALTIQELISGDTIVSLGKIHYSPDSQSYIDAQICDIKSGAIFYFDCNTSGGSSILFADFGTFTPIRSDTISVL